jgi:hypothetical protein
MPAIGISVAPAASSHTPSAHVAIDSIGKLA